MEYSRNTLIIFYDGDAGPELLMKAIKSFGAGIIYQYRTLNGVAISIPKGKTLEESIRFFKKVKGVIAVNKDYISHLDTNQ